MTRTNRNPVRPQILEHGAAAAADHPRITSASEFIEFVHQKKKDAQRRKDDLRAEIDRLEAERQRNLDDHTTEQQRLDAEIQSRLFDIEHEDDIIMRAGAALTIEPPVTRPAPVLAIRQPQPEPEGNSE